MKRIFIITLLITTIGIEASGKGRKRRGRSGSPTSNRTLENRNATEIFQDAQTRIAKPKLAELQKQNLDLKQQLKTARNALKASQDNNKNLEEMYQGSENPQNAETINPTNEIQTAEDLASYLSFNRSQSRAFLISALSKNEEGNPVLSESFKNILTKGTPDNINKLTAGLVSATTESCENLLTETKATRTQVKQMWQTTDRPWQKQSNYLKSLAHVSTCSQEIEEQHSFGLSEAQREAIISKLQVIESELLSTTKALLAQMAERTANLRGDANALLPGSMTDQTNLNSFTQNVLDYTEPEDQTDEEEEKEEKQDDGSSK